MSYLGLLESVRSRLEGNGPKFVPAFPGMEKHNQGDAMRPTRLSGVGRQADVDVDQKPDAFTKVGGIQVPIFFFDEQGERQEIIYPSLSYELIDFTPRYDEYVQSNRNYGGDVYCVPIIESAEEIVDENGESLGTHPRMIRQREVEHPMDALVEIRANSKDPIISALLVDYVWKVFPPRFYIRVPMKDGTYRSWDMLYKGFQDLDKREAVRSGTPGIIREYAKVWTFTVEAYFDNTDTSRLVNLNRRRIITPENLPDAC